MVHKIFWSVEKALEKHGEMFVDDIVVLVELVRLHYRVDDLATLTEADRVTLARNSAVEA